MGSSNYIYIGAVLRNSSLTICSLEEDRSPRAGGTPVGTHVAPVRVASYGLAGDVLLVESHATAV